MKLILKYILLFCFFAFLGFSREFLFVNINNQLYKLYYGHSNLPLPSSLQYIASISYQKLYFAKYILTVVYFLLYFLVAYLSVKIITNQLKITKWIVYIYALLLILASATMAYNYIINHNLSGNEYIFSRWLMGIAQSPLVAFFVIASHKLYTKFQTT